MRKLNERQTAALIKITCTVYVPNSLADLASFDSNWFHKRRYGTQCLRQEQGASLLQNI